MKQQIVLLLSALLLSVGCSSTESSCTTTECEACESCNPVIETIMARRSIRAYTDQSVERTKLERIVRCGINAPNGMNAQQWEIRVVSSKEWIDGATKSFKEAAKGTPSEKMTTDPSFKNMFRNAPVVIVVAHKPSLCTQVDCGLLAGNIMLSAKSLGLGTVCMMSPISFLTSAEGKPYLERLSLSEGYQPLLCIGVGYPAEEPEATPRREEVIKFIE